MIVEEGELMLGKKITKDIDCSFLSGLMSNVTFLGGLPLAYIQTEVDTPFMISKEPLYFSFKAKYVMLYASV